MNFSIFLVLLLCSSNGLTMNDDTQCSVRDSCSNSTFRSPSINGDELFIQQRNCFCDAACELYDDCCHGTSSSNSNYYECVDFLSPTSNKNNPIRFHALPVWMRTRCLPKHVGSQSDALCRNLHKDTFQGNPLLFVPVTSQRTNITYRNYYCAYCNDEVNINMRFWEYKVNCHGANFQSNYITVTQEEQMNYYIHNLTKGCSKTINYPCIQGSSVPSVFVRPCKYSMSASCPEGSLADLSRQCLHSSTAYRYDTFLNVTYRNIYCAQCNSINNTHNKHLTCADPFLRSSLSPTIQTRVPSLSILFDPNLLQRSLRYHSDNASLAKSTIHSLGRNCSRSNGIYDLFVNGCSQISDADRAMIESMKCAVPIKLSDDYVRYDNGSLFIVSHSILLNREYYAFIRDHEFLFCSDHWQRDTPKSPYYRNVLTILCTSLSLVCLVVFAIVFWLVPSLHNLPGKCLLFLSISIFIGQLTFIFMSLLIKYPSLCFASAILIHYFYLSSFFWLLIIATQIHSTFGCQTACQEKNINEKLCFVIYNIIVWCSSGTIVLVACFLQFNNPKSKFAPNYGGIFCSISQLNAMILFFLLPIGCSLIAIAVLFTKTISAIHRSYKIARLANASSSNPANNIRVVIYARLASLMGLQWILLILALVLKQNWFWIVFEIVNSLPGVFICVGFLCSQRIWNSVKQRIRTKMTVGRQSSRSNTTSTTFMQLPLKRSLL